MSEHVLAQTQQAKTSQPAANESAFLQHREWEQAEQSALQHWQINTVVSIFSAPRVGYDFSCVPVHTGMVRQNQPMLRTQPMVQRSPRNQAEGSAPCATCSDEESTPISALAEATPEATSPAPESTPTPMTAEPETESAVPEETSASALLVEDSTTELAPGQMRKSEFLAQLRTEVNRAAEAAMVGTRRTTRDCPYLNYWFGYYSLRDSTHIERAIHRYAPETAGVTTARGYIPIIAGRVRRAVEIWVRTGEVTGVPEGVPMGLPGMGLLGGLGRLISGIGSIFFKAREGGARAADDPQAIQAELGDGQPLDSGVRSRMESAFGTDFAHVRTHTDTTAAGLSNRLNARAFTVGEHVAFGSGEYKPGSLYGDALIAHELAHVVQQGNTDTAISPLKTDNGGYNALEQDADTSAAMAVASLWGKTRWATAAIAGSVLPRLRSGLRLQRCGTTRTATTPSAAASSGTSGTPCPTSVRVGAIVQRNHSDLSSTDKERYGTYIEATSRMDVGPGPDHSGHCMKERLTTVSNSCPAAAYFRGGRQTEPCRGDRCFGINQYAPRNFWGLTDSPTAFIDQHKTKIRDQSILEGTGVDSCSVVCDQTYTCDRIHPTTGTFRITRNFRAGTHNRSDGTTMHITTGTVTKTER